MTNDHILNSQPVLYLVNTVDALSARFFHMHLTSMRFALRVISWWAYAI